MARRSLPLRSSKRHRGSLAAFAARVEQRRVSEREIDRLLSGKSVATTMPPPPSSKELRELFAEVSEAEAVWRGKLARLNKLRG